MIRPFILLFFALSLRADSLQELASDYWTWRATTQPWTHDDIPRIERPATALPDWSPAGVEKQRLALARFDARWRKLTPESIPDKVDYRLMGSALARAHWELDIEQAWLRNPRFYIDQTVGTVFDTLLQPPPIKTGLIEQRLGRIPQTLAEARQNLKPERVVRPFAELAIASLKDIRARLAQTPVNAPDKLDKASTALEDFRDWLTANLQRMPTKTAIGRDNYIRFLRDIALVPFTPEQLLDMGRQEWERAVAFETYEQNRNREIPPLPLAVSTEAQMARERNDEANVRQFLEERNILTVPAWMRHYWNAPLPGYLGALAMGVTDDLTGPSRLKDDAVSYLRPPSLNLSYFSLATARDSRPILVHEGIPGHYFQLALSWAHENPIRRHYYDSGANEGIGFYAEEMMLQAGYFDDSPHTREIIYNFMRLRALRVEVDVKLALGLFTIPQAAKYLAETVPMDAETSLQEAADFASSPGQAISYQIGKIQIMRMLAKARRAQGAAFNLRAFHDFVWKNGNVPIALQQWELLNDPSDVPVH